MQHEWFNDCADSMVIFNEQEREVIHREFTFNDPTRYDRNPNDNQPWDCFTELNIDSMNQSLRNATSKSVILAPFNSSMSEGRSFINDEIENLIVDKKLVLKFAARCRDQDRQYEINNNCELDNGVYHKFVYSSQNEQEIPSSSDEDDDGLSSKMKQSTRNRMDDDSFDETRSYKQIEKRV